MWTQLHVLLIWTYSIVNEPCQHRDGFTWDISQTASTTVQSELLASQRPECVLHKNWGGRGRENSNQRFHNDALLILSHSDPVNHHHSLCGTQAFKREHTRDVMQHCVYFLYLLGAVAGNWLILKWSISENPDPWKSSDPNLDLNYAAHARF